MSNKPTDSDIVKALEWLESKTKEYCEQCAYKNGEVCDICVFDKIKLTLDLINRLQAKVYRLESKNSELEYDLSLLRQEREGIVKAEAYKECIEKVKEKYQIFENQAYAINPYALHNFLDNLLKELVGED